MSIFISQFCSIHGPLEGNVLIQRDVARRIQNHTAKVTVGSNSNWAQHTLKMHWDESIHQMAYFIRSYKGLKSPIGPIKTTPMQAAQAKIK